MFKLFKKKEKIDPNLLDITYSVSSGIPFRWEYVIEDESIIKFEKINYVSEKTKEPICGGNVDHHYLFKGLKRGKTKIIFKYVNFADNYLSEIETYKVEVDKDNIIKLISKESKRVR